MRPYFHKLSRVRKKCVLKVNCWLHNFDDVIWLIGAARSGTTWVSDLINYDKRYREFFEPFHPASVGAANFLSFHQYVRPQDPHVQLMRFSSNVFSGNLTNPVVDSQNRRLLYRGLLVKDIYANLFACWAFRRFPNLKIVLLLRNPFAVALSRFKTKDWGWVSDPKQLLNQPDLREDYLHPFTDLIERTSRKNDYILNQILIWAIINYVPLMQFHATDIYVAFYEEFCMDPIHHTSDLCSTFLGRGQIRLEQAYARRASRSATPEGTLLTGRSPVTSWKKELSSRQIDSGLRILDEFGFATLYDELSLPQRRDLARFHSKPIAA